MKMKDKRFSVSGIISKSLILSAIFSFVNSLYDKFSESFFGYILLGKKRDSSAENESKTFFQSVLEVIDFRKRVSTPVKRFFNGAIGESRILNAISAYFSALPSIRMHVVGVFLFSFGLYSAAISSLSKYAFNVATVTGAEVFLGVTVIVISIPLMLTHKTVSEAIDENRLFNFILFGVLGIKREYLITDLKRKGNSPIAFGLGMFLGLLTIRISPIYIVCGLAAIFVMSAILSQPEIGVVALFFALPFAPTMVIAGLIGFVFVCYILKLLQGKRTFSIKILDGFVLAFGIMTLLGGVVSVSPATSLKPALLYLCLMLGYFLCVNLIKSVKWGYRCIGAAVSSCTVVSLIGIYEHYFGPQQLISWIDENMFKDIENRVVSTFGNPNVLAEYLIMVLPFIVALLLISKRDKNKFGAFILFCATMGCIVFTWSRGAWLGAIIAMLFFFLVYSRKTLGALLTLSIGIPFLPFVLPDNIVSRFSSIGNLQDTSTSYRVNIWKGVIKMISDNLWHGVGVGEGAFSNVYLHYSLAGIETAPHSHNLFFQITVEQGIFGLMMFLITMFLFVRETLSFVRNERSAPDSIKLLSLGGLCGILAVLAQGMTDYVWYNYRIFAMFWLVIGIVCAIMRAYSSEKCQYVSSEPFIELDRDSLSVIKQSKR